MKKHFTSLIAIMMMAVSSIQVLAAPNGATSDGVKGGRGTSGAGGGDPMANDFLEIGWAIKSMLESQAVPRLNENSKEFGVWMARIQQSLDGEFPQVTFPKGSTVNCLGEEKVGCVDEAGKIKIARNTFEKYKRPERFELVAQEIFKLMDVENRYPKARMIADYVRIQTSTIESHVKFMIHYQITRFGFKNDKNEETLSPGTCAFLGGFIERIGILAELVQLLVIEGRMHNDVHLKAQELHDSVRDFYPYCEINKFKKSKLSFNNAAARVDEAITQLKAAIPAPENRMQLPPAAFVSPKDLVRTPKPGLTVGQVFALKKDLSIHPGDWGQYWQYYSNGKQIDVQTLLKSEGLSYCALSTTEGKTPKELIRGGVREIPKTISPLKLVDISYYVDTVFFDGNVENVGQVGIVVHCATMKDRSLDKGGLTSLDAIKKNLRGVLEIQ